MRVLGLYCGSALHVTYQALKIERWIAAGLGSKCTLPSAELKGKKNDEIETILSSCCIEVENPGLGLDGRKSAWNDIIGPLTKHLLSVTKNRQHSELPI